MLWGAAVAGARLHGDSYRDQIQDPDWLWIQIQTRITSPMWVVIQIQDLVLMSTGGGGGGGCDLLMTISAVTFTITSSRFQIFVCGDVAGHLAGP